MSELEDPGAVKAHILKGLLSMSCLRALKRRALRLMVVICLTVDAL